MSKILELSHVEKIYGEKENQVKALKDINIQVGEGEFIAIVGTSGSGKSTLLNLVGGLDTPKKGNIFVKGKEIGSLTRKELTKKATLTVKKSVGKGCWRKLNRGHSERYGIEELMDCLERNSLSGMKS